MHRLVALALVIGCSHTEPTIVGDYGADGPFITFPFPVMARDMDGAVWSHDGASIFVTFRHRSITADGKRADVEDVCLGTIPAGGGSIRRPVCHHQDGSVSYMASPAVDSDGRWLYTEAVQPLRYGHPFPVGWRADLWLGDPAHPALRRVRLHTLYRDNIGQPTVPAATVNWMTDLAWTARGTFVAKGYYLRPDGEFFLHGVVLGVIRDDRATLSVIPGTANAAAFAVAGDGTEIVMLDATLQVTRVDLATTHATTFHPIPNPAGREIIGIGCRRDACVLTVTRSGGPEIEAWTWVIGDAVATFGTQLPFEVQRALPSPVDDQLLVDVDGTLYLRPYEM